MGVTVNYGELDPDKLMVELGSIVHCGKLLGHATYCGMLHFEVYKGRTQVNCVYFVSSLEGRVTLMLVERRLFRNTPLGVRRQASRWDRLETLVQHDF